MTERTCTSSAAAVPYSMKPLRVLIVDDNRDGADSAGLLVEELGHNAHVTYGGRQALEVATAFRPDLLFVDLSMPDLDGFSLVKQFRQAAAFAQTRIVAITGHVDEGRKTSAIKAGCDAVLFKPATPTDIKKALASVTAVVADTDQPHRVPERGGLGTERRLPIDEASRIRKRRNS